MTDYVKGDLVVLNKSCQNWLSCKFAYVHSIESSTNTAYIVVCEKHIDSGGNRFAVGISQISKPTTRQLKHLRNIKELHRQNTFYK